MGIDKKNEVSQPEMLPSKTKKGIFYLYSKTATANFAQIFAS